MSNWETQFEPLKNALNLSVRNEQKIFADAVIDTMNSPIGTKHICAEAGTGTGKSFAYLVPLIHKVKEKGYKGVVSTETLTLQDQIAHKDLPLLQKVYGGFTFASLKGRTNYVCLIRANTEIRFHPEIAQYISNIEAKVGQFEEGTQDELSSLLGERIPDDIWRYISGEPEFCADCDGAQGCYSTVARERAAVRDIVVTNHAMLHANGASDGSILGERQYIIIDEAHTLEDVFIGSLQIDISGWEIKKMMDSVSKGCNLASTLLMDPGLASSSDILNKDITSILNAIIEFYSSITPGSWDDAEGVLKQRTVFMSDGPRAVEAMRVLEDDIPLTIDSVISYLKKIKGSLNDAKDMMINGGKKTGIRTITKALTAIQTLNRVVTMVKDTIYSRDGVVYEFGIPYVVEFSGYVDKEGTKRINISFVPLDVSHQLSETVWRFDATTGKAESTCIIVSATLTDITDGSFRFARTSIGFPTAGVTEMTVQSPFDYDEQQLIYTTPGSYDIVPVERAQYSLDEAVELIQRAGGRSLLLFTAKAELEYAAEELRSMNLPYAVYVQGEGMSKKELSDAFMADTSSILLATKSFFTGVNFSGDACSMVIICKFPLKRFTGVCQAQIAHWRTRGFPKWYEMQSLTVFRQAVGRLIRSETDRGVVAIIDKRVSNPRERVYDTASMGIATLGSIVTNSMEDIDEFFA